MGGSKTSTESKTTVDPQLLALYNQNYARASEVADTPFTPYTGERVAGFNPTQTAAKGILEQVAGNQTGKPALDQASSIVRGILDYRPQTLTAGQIKDTDLSPYMNPYTQNVIDASLSDLSRARDVQRVADNQTATRQGAFGGTRQSVADMLTNDAYLRNVASTTAGLRASAFDKAVGLAGDDISRRYAADSQNVANDITGAGVRQGAARTLADFSDQELLQALKRAGALGAVGDAEHQIDQARNDANYQEFLRMIGYPIQQQQLRNQALGMIPMQQTQTSTSKQSGGGILDLIAPIGAIASGIGSLGLFGGGGLSSAANYNAFGDPFFGT